MTTERATVLELLPTHRLLYERHRHRLRDLISLASDDEPLGAIIASVAGDFGQATLDAGPEFLSGLAVVAPLGVDGLAAIVAATIPEMLGPLHDRRPGQLPIVIVDDADEPALLLIPEAVMRSHGDS